MPNTLIRPAMAAALAWSAATALAQTVTPPPLPPGSRLVRPEAGLNEAEKKRYVRAHHHKMHNRKDYTHDDTLPVSQRPGDAGMGAAMQGGAGAANRAGPAGAGSGAGAGSLGGAGTGPARERTDKGASSYFFGTSKK